MSTPLSNSERSAKDKELFDRIAGTYAKKDLYPASRVARKCRLLQSIRTVPAGNLGDVLEVGCGAGFAAEYLKGMYQTFTGIDYSKELIRYANSHHSNEQVSFKEADLYHFTPEKTFDLIFMIGVLHHMTDIKAAVNIMASFLKPGGYLVVNEPQPSNFMFHFMRQLRTKMDSGYSSDQEELRAKDISVLFEQSGLERITASGQGFFSTPYAEVMLKPNGLTKPLCHGACAVDRLLEKHLPTFIKGLCWNVIVAGRKKPPQQR